MYTNKRGSTKIITVARKRIKKMVVKECKEVRNALEEAEKRMCIGKRDITSQGNIYWLSGAAGFMSDEREPRWKR